MRSFFAVFGLFFALSIAILCGMDAAAAETPVDAIGAQALPAQSVDSGKSRSDMDFLTIVTRAGKFGVLIWLMLFAASIACFALVIDSFISIRENKISPKKLADSVSKAVEQGDLTSAVKLCDESGVPLGRILKAAFLNIQEGFEAVQDAVGVAADIESETLLARVSYLSVISNTTPMLGLIGTVQGMIFAFFTLGTQEAGAAQQSMLAINISHGLWATAVGLGISVPAAILFYFFKNRTMRLILGMEALTLEITKSLRNAELLADDNASAK